MRLGSAAAAMTASFAVAAWSVPGLAQQGFYVPQPTPYYYNPGFVQANPGYVPNYPGYYVQPPNGTNYTGPQFTVPGSATAPIGPPIASSVPLGQQATIQQPANALRPDQSQQAIKPPSIGTGSSSSTAQGTQTNPRGAVIEGTARVIDGDTFTVDQQMVVLYGAEAPEIDQLCYSGTTAWRCGVRAKEELARLIDGRQVSCIGQRQAGDAISAQCIVPTGDVAAQMVGAGFAVVPWELSKEYLSAQEMAKGAGRGVWAGRFEWPWDFRSKSQLVRLAR